MYHLQSWPYPRIPLLRQHFRSWVDVQATIGYFLASGHTLRFLDMHIHSTKVSHLTPVSIAGEENDIADFVSRAFQKSKFFTANNNLTSYFWNIFLLPQGHFWTEFTLPPKWTQRVMSCLLGEQLTLGSLLRIPRMTKNIGRHGKSMPPHGTLTLYYKTANKFTSPLSPHLLLHKPGKATTERAFKSRLQPLLNLYWA